MKRIPLIISLVVLFALNGNAQIGDLRFGLKLGPSFDWASSGSVETANKGVGMGFGAGVVVDYCFTDHVMFSSGVDVNYYRMRYRFTDYRKTAGFLVDTEVPVMRRLQATNLDFPIKVKVKYGVADLFDAYAEAGFGLGFNLKDYGKDEYELYWTEYHSEYYEDCTNQYRAFQPSMIFGLGAEYELNQKLSVFAQLSFHHAFLNAFVGSLEDHTGSILRNNFIGVELGLMY